jgi:GNAT superfamily N-acetyltransferase
LDLHTFTNSDIPAACELLAQRQRRARLAQPQLPAAYEDPSSWQEGVVDAAGKSEGVAVREGGRLVGFMLGRKELTPEDSLGARWGHPRAGVVPIDAYACAVDVDPLRVYTEMYMAASEDWVRDGFFAHSVQVMAADQAAHDALVALGFGRRFVAAVRDIEPLPALSATVNVREATGDDTKAVHALEMELDLYHARAPIFLPMDPSTHEAASQFMDAVIENPENAIFLAEQGGRPAGMNSLLVQSFIPKCVLKERSLYLYQGIVSGSARSGGIGEALLARSPQWAHDQGYEQMALHYFSANPTGGFFWRKHGFEAVQYAMTRLVDERIAWARDWR